jgi:hypothetical protein
VTSQRVRLAVGTKLAYDGELVEVVEFHPSASGNEVVLRNNSGRLVRRVALKELLAAHGSSLPVGEFSVEPHDDETEPLGPGLADLTPADRELVLARAGHVREVLTGTDRAAPSWPTRTSPDPDSPRFWH